MQVCINIYIIIKYLFGILRDYTWKLICLNRGYKNFVNIRYNSTLFNNVEYQRSQLGHYLAGLIEGDGSIIIPKSVRSSKGKLNYPSIQISFHTKDFPLCWKIREILNDGSIQKKAKKDCYVLIINDYKTIILLTKLINGKFRTNKIHRLWLLIDWLNNPPLNEMKDKSKLLFKDLYLEKKDINSDSLNNDAWLSGILDADGNCYIRHSMNSKNIIITQYYIRLSQSCINSWGEDNINIMQKISEYLHTIVKTDNRKDGTSNYLIRTTSRYSNDIIVEYLTKFPLFSSKYLDYQDWLNVYNLYDYNIKQLKHTENNINIIIQSKLNMNNNRTFFNWDHLNNFYILN